MDGLFEERASRTPSAVALYAHASAHPHAHQPTGHHKEAECHLSDSVSYQQLNERSTKLASSLRGLGIGPGHVVAVRAGRTIGAVVALLGVCKAGGAFLPVAPDDPPQRVAQCLAQAHVRGLIIVGERQPLSETLLQTGGGAECCDGPVIRVDASGEVVAVVSTARNERRQHGGGDLPASTLYVIFTSGTDSNQFVVWLSRCASVAVSLSVCLSFGVSVCLSICLSVCVSVCVSVCLPVCLPVYTHIYWPGQVALEWRRVSPARTQG